MHENSFINSFSDLSDIISPVNLFVFSHGGTRGREREKKFFQFYIPVLDQSKVVYVTLDKRERGEGKTVLCINFTKT